MDFAFSVQIAYLFSRHCNITILFPSFNLKRVLDVPFFPDLFQAGRPLERGSALMTKAGTNQQPFNFARISRSGVQILTYKASFRNSTIRNGKAEKTAEEEIWMIVPVWMYAKIEETVAWLMKAIMPETGLMQFQIYVYFNKEQFLYPSCSLISNFISISWRSQWTLLSQCK